MCTIASWAFTPCCNRTASIPSLGHPGRRYRLHPGHSRYFSARARVAIQNEKNPKQSPNRSRSRQKFCGPNPNNPLTAKPLGTTSFPKGGSSFLASSASSVGRSISPLPRQNSPNTPGKTSLRGIGPSKRQRPFAKNSALTSKAINAPPRLSATSVPTISRISFATSTWRAQTRSSPNTQNRGTGMCAGSNPWKKKNSPSASTGKASYRTSRMPFPKTGRGATLNTEAAQKIAEVFFGGTPQARGRRYRAVQTP